jgi:hypothetical protein
MTKAGRPRRPQIIASFKKTAGFPAVFAFPGARIHFVFPAEKCRHIAGHAGFALLNDAVP